MKKSYNRLMITMLISLLFTVITEQKILAQDVTVSYQAFYDDLTPYGQWMNDPQYGNVWVPNVDGGFQPYFNDGYWAMTDYGNTWVSDEPWGWICYHYGRWTNDPYYGWIWLPGYDWAPAWVSWRFGGGYCGWAPLGPGVSLDATYNCPDNWWVFVGAQYMYQPDFAHHWRGTSNNAHYIHKTSFMNNFYVDNHTHVRYNFGPRADAIQQVTHRPVQVYHVSQAGKQRIAGISGNSISMYRPDVNRATVNNARPAKVIPVPMQISAPKPSKTIASKNTSAFRQQGVTHSAGNRGTANPGNTPRQAHSYTGNNQHSANRQIQNRPQSQPQNHPRTGIRQQTRTAPPQRQPHISRPQPAMRPQPQMRPPQPAMRPQPQMRPPQPPRPAPQPPREAPHR